MIPNKGGKLRVGLFGAGRIAPKHVQSILVDPSRFECSGFIEINDAVAEKFEKKYRIKRFASSKELSKKSDLISILSESGKHKAHAIEVINYGKSVLIEKPMALTPKDCDAIIEASNKKNVRVFTVKQNRYNNAVSKAKVVQNKGILGSLMMVTGRVRWSRDASYYEQADWRGSWKYDGGVLANQAVHYLDLLSWFIGPIQKVSAFANNFNSNIEAEDTIVMNLLGKNGVLGNLEATTAVRPKNLEGSLSLLSSKGSIVISGHALNKVETWDANEYPAAQDGNEDDVSSVYGNGHLQLYKSIHYAIKTGRPHILEGAEGKKSVSLLNAAYESVASGKVVDLNNALENSPLIKAAD